jgi:hypothetical protein
VVSDSEKNRKADEWSEADVAFVGEMVHMTATGDVQTYGADEDDVLQADTSQVYEPYGYYSWIPDGTETLELPKNDEEVAIVGVNVARPSLGAQGEVMIKDAAGNFFNLRSTDAGIIIEDKQANKITLQADSGGIIVEARSGQNVVTKSPTFLGAVAASQMMLQGTIVKLAFTAYLGGLSTFVTALQGAVDPVVANAATAFLPFVTALQGSLATWESTKHKLDG